MHSLFAPYPLCNIVLLFEQQFAVQAFMAAKSKKAFCALPESVTVRYRRAVRNH